MTSNDHRHPDVEEMAHRWMPHVEVDVKAWVAEHRDVWPGNVDVVVETANPTNGDPIG